jgi:hypothetical protein
MANLTLSIEDETLHEARKYALEHRTTVNQLVREYLSGLSGLQERRRIARERLLEMMKRGLVELGPITWKREDLYERK